MSQQAPAEARGGEELDRYEAVSQYTLGQIFGIWAAVAVPMGVLAWIVAPLLEDQFGGTDPLITALLILLNAGLIWQLILTLILVRREQGSLAWARVRDALWLRAPRDPKTGRVGGKLWWWIVPFAVAGAAVSSIPIYPSGPAPRDLPNLLGTDRAEDYFSGNWGGFALLVGVALLAPWVEELFFRGLLLPRMRDAVGRFDWVLNGALFAGYHFHQPWSMPSSVLDGIFFQAFPTKRFQSIWIAAVGHTLPSFIIIGVVLAVVI